MNARTFAVFATAAALVFKLGPACAGDMPPDLVKLERQVSLELAHVRDSGPTDPVKRQQLFHAKQLEQNADDKIRTGDYKSAEDSLLQAQVILRQLSD